MAGVDDLDHLSPFERAALEAARCPAVADRLVDAAVVAALFGRALAACGLPSG